MASFKVYCHFEEAEPNMTHGFRLSKPDDESRTIGSLLEVRGPPTFQHGHGGDALRPTWAHAS
jgi:hypothetical protein